MDAQKYLESHWGTGGITHSQMIQFMEEYADIKLAEFKAKNLPQSDVIGSLLTDADWETIETEMQKYCDNHMVYIRQYPPSIVSFLRHTCSVFKSKDR